MGNLIDDAFDRFGTIRPELDAALGGSPNEADTRLKVLDRILFEVLQWSYERVFAEPPTSSGFIDYLLRTELSDGRLRGIMVIEAKRSGLLRPVTKSEEIMTVSLKGPVVRPLAGGLEQAMRYANEQGVPVAAVTDGATWLFFKASRGDGIPPLTGKGILFPNLNSVATHFATFVELLSFNALVSRHNLAHLNDAEGITASDLEEQVYVLNPAEARMRSRDALASDAALLFEQFFSRITDAKDREMLRDCFVETSESKKADLELEKILQRVLNTVTTLDTKESGALQAEIERTIASQRSETVLLIGNKGSGKSTFIDRFFSQVLPVHIRNHCVVALVDMEEFHGDGDGVISWALSELRMRLEEVVFSSDPPTYEELMGVFFYEYKRLMVGSRKHLYETDKNAFKDEFGRHIEERREERPDEYVKLLLDWSTRGHGKLPCLVFDNTDQFPAQVQDLVYQLAHSLESAAPVFNVVPITDRTIWRLSKAGSLQSYTARSFYLPAPDAKEIISRRVKFLQSKVGLEPKAAKSYFSRLGFQVEVNDLVILADAVGKVFVQNDYISGFIGRLGNFDIRRMLRIAERIFLSPDLKIDEIIKSRFGGEDIVTADPLRTHRALIRGEYDRFTESENEYVSNLFQTNPERPGSPLLLYYLLILLRQRLIAVRGDDEDVDSRHWLVSDLTAIFEACGVAEDIVVAGLNRLFERRLVETLDPNAERVALFDRVAMKESGLAHLELVSNSTVYLEQMALTTGLNELAVRDEIRSALPKGEFRSIRDAFLRYVIKIDAGRIGIPGGDAYSQISVARRSLEQLVTARSTRPAPSA